MSMFYNPNNLQFRLRGIAAGVHPFECLIDPSLIDIAEVVSIIDIKGELTASDLFVFKMQIATTLGLICDRCTEGFEYPVKTPLEVIYVRSGNEEDMPDSGYLHTFDGIQLFEVDLTEDVHDAIFLTLPMKRLCRPDCPGIPLTDNEPEEVDERFSPLAQLLSKLKSEEE